MAVSKINKSEMYHAFSVMDENRCPLYMVGNSTEEELIELMNEWGSELKFSEGWFYQYGDAESAIFLGYDILQSEGLLK